VEDIELMGHNISVMFYGTAVVSTALFILTVIGNSVETSVFRPSGMVLCRNAPGGQHIIDTVATNLLVQTTALTDTIQTYQPFKHTTVNQDCTGVIAVICY
jgi:hypothetical protein